MTESNHKYIYSVEDIQRYLDGQMTAPEMNAFEKLALEDELLAEALEGFQTVPRADWEKALQALRKNFAESENSQEAKLIAISPSRGPWWKYAAAVVIIGGGITAYLALSHQTTSDKGLPGIAKTKDKSVPPQALLNTAEPDSIGKKSNIAIVTSPGSEKPRGTSSQLSTQRRAHFVASPSTQNYLSNNLIKIPRHASSDSLYDRDKRLLADAPEMKERHFPDRSRKTDSSRLKKVNTSADDLSANAQPKVTLLNQQNINLGYDNNNAGMVSKKKDKENNKTFFAQVLGPDSNPLPFANINVTNQGFGTYADVKGNVRLVSTDSVIPVEVKSLGYATQYITLHSNNQNRIILKENAFAANEKLEKATNSSNGRIYKKYTPVQDSTNNAEPADGWDNYNTYVLNNLEIPDEVLNKNVHGDVEISFDVQRNGTVTNVKVDKSLCSDCDEIARRLVEQGPQWKVKKGNHAKVKVKVQF